MRSRFSSFCWMRFSRAESSCRFWRFSFSNSVLALNMLSLASIWASLRAVSAFFSAFSMIDLAMASTSAILPWSMFFLRKNPIRRPITSVAMDASSSTVMFISLQPPLQRGNQMLRAQPPGADKTVPR